MDRTQIANKLKGQIREFSGKLSFSGPLTKVPKEYICLRCQLKATFSEKDMTKKHLSGGKGLLVFAALLVSIATLLCLLVLGPVHNHSDFKTHRDCSACHWQAFFSLLLHEGVALVLIVPVGFLATLWVPLPVSARSTGQLSIRAPPRLLD